NFMVESWNAGICGHQSAPEFHKDQVSGWSPWTSCWVARPSVLRGGIMESLHDQVVVITGASSGFGKGAALRFAEEGANLVLAARRKGLLKELAKGCEKLGVKTVVVETDVSNSDDIEELAEK